VVDPAVGLGLMRGAGGAGPGHDRTGEGGDGPVAASFQTVVPAAEASQVVCSGRTAGGGVVVVERLPVVEVAAGGGNAAAGELAVAIPGADQAPSFELGR